MSFKFCLTVFTILLSDICLAQDAIQFPNLQIASTSFTEDAIYMSSNYLIKSDYNGNILWSRSPGLGNVNIKVEGADLYMANYAQIYKLDTAGNIQWVYEINQRPCTLSSQLPAISDYVVNRDKIYVLMEQPYLGIGNRYISMLVLDTSGTVLNSWCGANLWNFAVMKGIKSDAYGAWIMLSTGPLYYGQLSIRIDTLGNFIPANHHMIDGAEFHYTYDIITLSDNSHMYLGWGRLTPEDRAFIYNETDQGSTYGFQSYNILNSSDGPFFLKATRDQNDNLYILIRHNDNTSSATLYSVSKISRNGLVQFCKGWTQSTFNSYGLDFNKSNLFLKNDSLCLTSGLSGKQAILYFDTAMNSTCYPPDTTFDLYISNIFNIQSIQITTAEQAINYVPDSIFRVNSIVNQLPGSSACMILNVDPTIDESALDLYPNPVQHDININSSINLYGYEIFDYSGKKIKYQSGLNTDKFKIDTSDLSNGIHFLKFISNNAVHIKKFLVVK